MLKISTKKNIGYRISDIGAGGKEYNVKESKPIDVSLKATLIRKGKKVGNLGNEDRFYG